MYIYIYMYILIYIYIFIHIYTCPCSHKLLLKDFTACLQLALKHRTAEEMAIVGWIPEISKLSEVFYRFEVEISLKVLQLAVVLSLAVIWWTGFAAGKAWQRYQTPELKLKEMPEQLLKAATGDKLHLKGCSYLGAGSTSYQMCKRCTKAYTLD